MSVLNDLDIEGRCHSYTTKPMINPIFMERLGSFGYDMTLHSEYMIPNSKITSLDPKNMSENMFDRVVRSYRTAIPPHSFILGRSVEYFCIPHDIIGICLGRSSYARCGIICHVTPLEPGWEGYVTVEISNSNDVPAYVYSNEGISQVLFFSGKAPRRLYGVRSDKYQFQSKIEISRGL